MIFITWNVNSITARAPHVEELLDSYDPDVLCLQETKIVDEKFPSEIFTSRGYEVEMYGEKTYNGVAIISKEGLTDVVKGFETEVGPGSRRLIAGQLNDLKILNCYIPNGQAVGSEKYHYKLEWLAALKKHIETHYAPDDQLVICGDFNVAPEDIDLYKPEEWNGAIMASETERKALDHIKEWGFTDVFRQHNKEAGLYSWWDYQKGAFRRNAGFRIDHVWTTAPLAKRCTGVLIAREVRELERPSDHAPVVAEFEL